jgi:hypothetical protein
MFGFFEAAAQQDQDDRRQHTGEHHIAPAIGSDDREKLAADQAAETTACHHDAQDLGAVRVGECLGHQRDAEDNFSPRADPGEEAADAEGQGTVGEALQGGEDGHQHHTEHQCSHSPEVIAENAEHEAAERPAEQAGHTEQAANPADIRGGRVSTNQFGHRRVQHQGEQAEVGVVQ